MDESPVLSCRTDSINGEDTALLPDKTRPRWSWSWLAMRYGTTCKCVSSKAALLILLWSFVVVLLNRLILNPNMLFLVKLDTAIASFVAFVGTAIGTACFFQCLQPAHLRISINLSHFQYFWSEFSIFLIFSHTNVLQPKHSTSVFFEILQYFQ